MTVPDLQKLLFRVQGLLDPYHGQIQKIIVSLITQLMKIYWELTWVVARQYLKMSDSNFIVHQTRFQEDMKLVHFIFGKFCINASIIVW